MSATLIDVGVLNQTTLLPQLGQIFSDKKCTEPAIGSHGKTGWCYQGIGAEPLQVFFYGKEGCASWLSAEDFKKKKLQMGEEWWAKNRQRVRSAQCRAFRLYFGHDGCYRNY